MNIISNCCNSTHLSKFHGIPMSDNGFFSYHVNQLVHEAGICTRFIVQIT